MIDDTSRQDRLIARKKPWVKWAWIALSVLAAIALLYGVIQRFPLLRAEPSVAYARLRTAVVERGVLVRDVKVEGRIVASSFPTLFSPAQGIASVHVKPGAPVTLGQVLVTVDSPELMIEMQQEESTRDALAAELSRLRIERKTALMEHKRNNELKRLRLDAAQRAFRRAQQSRDQGLINATEYEAAQDAVRIAEMELDNGLAKAALDQERYDFEIRNQEALARRQDLVLEDKTRRVDELTILSPVDGLVGNVEVDQSDWIRAGQPLMTVIDLSSFEVEIEIPETYADEVTAGVQAEIHYMGRKYSGTVSHVAPEVKHSVVVGSVEFDDQVPGGLRQNQRVSTRVILARREGVTKVTRGPFLEQFGGRKVYRVEGNRAVLTPIETGLVCVGEVEILEGLAVGDEVVLSNMDGVRVSPLIWIRR